MRTEISSVGKEALLSRFFDKSGFTNSRTIDINWTGQCTSAHRTMLEGVDFDLVYTPLKHLGYKAVLCVLGELYAAFRAPATLSVALGLSSRFCCEDVEELWSGILAACREHGIKSVSLDLNPSVNGLCISLAACGLQKKKVLDRRPEIKNLDLICLSGHLGAAYMGLHILEREKISFTSTDTQPDLSKYKAVLASYLSPEIKPNLLDRFIEADIIPSTGWFIDRGLGAAVLRLTRATGLGAKIYIEKMPVSTRTFEVADELELDPITAAMNGGDDYKFIFTIPIEKHEAFRKEFHDFDVIGHMARPETGAVLVSPEGAEFEIKAQGFQSGME